MRLAAAPAVPQATPATVRQARPRPEDKPAGDEPAEDGSAERRPETEVDTTVLRNRVVMGTRMRAAPPGAPGSEPGAAAYRGARLSGGRGENCGQSHNRSP